MRNRVLPLLLTICIFMGKGFLFGDALFIGRVLRELQTILPSRYYLGKGQGMHLLMLSEIDSGCIC